MPDLRRGSRFNSEEQIGKELLKQDIEEVDSEDDEVILSNNGTDDDEFFFDIGNKKKNGGPFQPGSNS